MMFNSVLEAGCYFGRCRWIDWQPYWLAVTHCNEKVMHFYPKDDLNWQIVGPQVNMMFSRMLLSYSKCWHHNSDLCHWTGSQIRVWSKKNIFNCRFYGHIPSFSLFSFSRVKELCRLTHKQSTWTWGWTTETGRSSSLNKIIILTTTASHWREKLISSPLRVKNTVMHWPEGLLEHEKEERNLTQNLWIINQSINNRETAYSALCLWNSVKKTKQGAEPTAVSMAFVTSSRADFISVLFQLLPTVWQL